MPYLIQFMATETPGRWWKWLRQLLIQRQPKHIDKLLYVWEHAKQFYVYLMIFLWFWDIRFDCSSMPGYHSSPSVPPVPTWMQGQKQENKNQETFDLVSVITLLYCVTLGNSFPLSGLHFTHQCKEFELSLRILPTLSYNFLSK